jgi:hypothetical protein
MGYSDKLFKKPERSPDGCFENPNIRNIQGLRQQKNIYTRALNAHFRSLFPGRRHAVLSELSPEMIRVNIAVMGPTEEENFFVLYTVGMSDLPMESEEHKRAELYMFLPADWDFGAMISTCDGMPESSFWPIRMMRFLARYPH